MSNSMSNGPFMYPNVTSLPGQSGVSTTDAKGPIKRPGEKTEFDAALEKALTPAGESGASELKNVREPLKFSAHANQRLMDRKIKIDPATMAKVNDAVDKAASKGIEDTLVLTNDAALIVNVKNRTVVTAMDRGSLSGNVFTNIDGAVIV